MTFGNRPTSVTSAAPVMISLVALICLAGCGGGGVLTQLQGPQVSIEIQPVPASAALTLGPGNTLGFTATVYDQSNNGVTWTITPNTIGALSQVTPTSVTYATPANVPNLTKVTLTATSVTNPLVSSSLQMTVSPISASLAFPQPVGEGGPPVPASDQTISPGGTISLQAFIAWASSGNSLPSMTWDLFPASGAGALTPLNGTSLVNTTSDFVTYTAPASVTESTMATVTVTSAADASVSASVRITVLPSGAGPNVAVLNVDGGPVPGQIYENGAFLNGVTICNPGAPPAGTFSFPVCQKVDGILVDTGSYGLRILQSAIPNLTLPTMENAQEEILKNCYSYPDGSYLWGPVASADLYISGEAASTYTSFAGIGNATPLLVQVVSANAADVPDGCSNGGTALNTPQLLGANGILGIGPEPTDCTLAGVNYCDGSSQPAPPNIYFACPTTGCQPSTTPVIVTSLQQVANPVPKFLSTLQIPTGSIIDLSAVSGTETSVNGTLTFATFLPGATTYTLDSNDHFITIFGGQNLTSSFIDSGSNALYFPDSLLVCQDKTQFFCPSSLTTLSGINEGVTQGQSTVDFSIDNADNLFSANPDDSAFGTLAGPSGKGSCSNGTGACTFEWGLPFFYGRPVFTKVDSCSATAGPCPPLAGATWAY
jgi:Protein of unknown function (DUF3443)